MTEPTPMTRVLREAIDVEPRTEIWPWQKRAYANADQDIVISLWLETHAWSGAAHRHRARDRDGYWNQHRDIVVALVDRCMVEVLVDSQDPRIVWAFACFSPGIVHFAAVKKKYAEFKDEMLADLIGSQYHLPLRHSYVIPQLLPMPPSWVFDPHCLFDILKQPSARRAAFLEMQHATNIVHAPVICGSAQAIVVPRDGGHDIELPGR